MTVRTILLRLTPLVDIGGQGVAARAPLPQAPPGKGPCYLGERNSGRYVSSFEVVDTVGLRTASGDH